MPGANVAKAARQDPGMDNREAVILLLAVLAVLLTMGGLMVRPPTRGIDGPRQPMCMNSTLGLLLTRWLPRSGPPIS